MKIILLIIWMLFTILLTCSIVGMFLFVPNIYTTGPNNPSSWMTIGLKLVDKIVNK